MQHDNVDIAILGGGLAGGLIALALAKLRPELRVAVIEAGAQAGGNHVWSFFASDVAPEHAWLVEPLIEHRWDDYEVRFPKFSRVLPTPYRSFSSKALDAALRARCAAGTLRFSREVIAAARTRVTLADQSVIAAGAVIDARGTRGFARLTGGWQNFVGQHLRLAAPHGLVRPVVMDASVAQIDGYRFVYLLPFGPREVFVEDTYYAESPMFDRDVLAGRIAAYAAAQGWDITAVLGEERGALPVIGGGSFDRCWPADDPGPARAGARAVLVHPLTSYSLPDAVRFAVHVAGLSDLSGDALAHESRRYAAAVWQRGGFYRLLGRMMFGAATPARRYRTLEHFYTKPAALIERFYAGRSHWSDPARILTGRPPVSLRRAINAVRGRGRPLTPLDSGGLSG